MTIRFFRALPFMRMPKLKDILFWSSFLILIFLFVLTKYQGPKLIEHFYTQGSYDLLNKGLGISGQQSLDFYLGVADNRLLGPLSSLAAGAALLLFCWRFLKEAKGWVFGLVVLVYLFLTRLEVLFYPPYGDAVGGIFTDVIWIVRHHFNVYDFFVHQKSFGIGGYKQYPVSLYPSFLAFLIMITPTTKAFLVTTHSLVFIMGAAMATFFRKLSRELFDKEVSLLLALSLVALPLFQGMAETINMEMASAFFSLLAVYFLIRERMALTVVMAVLALLVKATGITTCATVFFGCLLMFMISPEKTNRKTALLCGLGILVFACGMTALRIYLIGPQENTTNVAHLWIGLRNLKGLAVLKMYAVAALVFVVRSVFWLRRDWKEPRLFRFFFKEHYVVLVMLAMCTSWFLLYMNFLVMIHRYKLLLAPFLMMAMAATFLPLIKRKSAVKILLAAGILFSFFCSHGLLYQNSPDVSQNEFEGSLEYRNELKLQMRLAKKVEEQFSEFLIGAPYLMVQSMDFHEIGFVNKPLNMMVYGHMSINEGIKVFRGLSELDIFRTIWVGFHKDYFNNDFFDFPVGPDDRILYEMEVGDQKGYIFLGGFAIERRLRIIQRAMVLIELQKQGKLPPELEKDLRAFLNMN